MDKSTKNVTLESGRGFMAKTVLVTGASSGIGEETVKALLAAGYVVYAGARRVDRMQKLASAGARLLSLDVTDDTSMTAAVETILQGTGRIDVLINNAGHNSYGALEDVPLAEARRQFDVNVFGLARSRFRRCGRATSTMPLPFSMRSPVTFPRACRYAPPAVRI